jgi:hypothetical protein
VKLSKALFLIVISVAFGLLPVAQPAGISKAKPLSFGLAPVCPERCSGQNPGEKARTIEK